MAPASRYSLAGWLKAETPDGAFHAAVQQLWRGWMQFLHHPRGLFGAAIIFLLIVAALFAPVLTPYDPAVQDMMGRLQPPSATHWFGSDEFGRDIFARLVYGARTTLYIIALVTVIVAPVGLLIGVCAGYLGGLADEILMRITDVFLALPGLVLALGFAAALGAGITNAIIAIALTVAGVWLLNILLPISS